jgi:hypothetical protein
MVEMGEIPQSDDDAGEEPSTGRPPEDSDRRLVIEITPTPAEYRRLTADLARLRALGFPSNTTAVVAAVHALASESGKSAELAAQDTSGEKPSSDP